MAIWRKPVTWLRSNSDVDLSEVRGANEQVGDHIFVDGVEIFQDKTGAPVEQASPLGYHVGWVGIICLNISQMIGTGIFSTPGSILAGLGSVGLSLLYWVIGGIISAGMFLTSLNILRLPLIHDGRIAALSIYLEYTALFPNRSGALVVYLEQAFPKPRFLFPATFAFFTVAFSFSSSNAIVLARYIYRAAGHTATEWENKGLALASYSVLAFLCLISTKWSMRIMNLISIVKLIILLFVVITGFVVLGGGTRVKDPYANFRNAFEGTTSNGNAVATSLVKINFAYSGYANAFNVVSEIKNPMRSLKIHTPISLLIVVVLYVLANVAYFAAVPKEVIRDSGELTAALFFEAVFGKAGRVLPALVAISAAGNIMAVIIGTTRQIREVARQGLIPWPGVWVSTKPFGTPLAPILLKWTTTSIVILALPFGDAFNFLVDLRSYPDSIFLALMFIGIYIIRYRRKQQGLPKAQFEAWHVAITLSIAVCVFVLIMPWYPPKGGSKGGDVSFWYATYCVVGLCLMVGCGVYYFFWLELLPRLRDYSIRTETFVMEGDGSVTARLLKIPNHALAEYDRTHDASGNLLAEEASDVTATTTANLRMKKRIHVKDSRATSAAVEYVQPKV
ncbi:LAT family L-amino acid transporter [Pseudovirgaria hyperparasitica]|uniref:LAT family L-amino acid transporter n=1 Tax=Pseudovirgaria hyperparasitica TaxID=470096 RepID=A0A6A6VWU5_9PEZI|nr:LAT family L-amino acid transporter [Pseudovirgaria hyperparasitica]KAF2754184.1 LAT family L-amino acid transporter [Pseudovirgaria hyperparasitica]